MALVQKEITETFCFRETIMRLRNISTDGGEDNKTIIMTNNWDDIEKVETEWEEE